MQQFRSAHLHRLPGTEEDDEVFVQKMNNILSGPPYIGVPPEPTAIASRVYLGTTANAENISLLKSMGITFILNCAGGTAVGLPRRRARYTPDTGVQGYEELAIEDWEDTDIRSWFERALNLVDYWKGKNLNGKILIHCPGVSRSGAIALAYMCRRGEPLLVATKALKEQRRCLLTNEGFIRQLVTWARDRGMGDANVNAVSAPTYGRALDTWRYKYAHLPTFL